MLCCVLNCCVVACVVCVGVAFGVCGVGLLVVYSFFVVVRCCHVFELCCL